jgi:hypothetical protein
VAPHSPAARGALTTQGPHPGRRPLTWGVSSISPRAVLAEAMECFVPPRVASRPEPVASCSLLEDFDLVGAAPNCSVGGGGFRTLAQRGCALAAGCASPPGPAKVRLTNKTISSSPFAHLVLGLFLPLSGNQHATGAPIGFISLLMLTRVLPQTSKSQKGKKAQQASDSDLAPRPPRPHCEKSRSQDAKPTLLPNPQSYKPRLKPGAQEEPPSSELPIMGAAVRARGGHLRSGV